MHELASQNPMPVPVPGAGAGAGARGYRAVLLTNARHKKMCVMWYLFKSLELLACKFPIFFLPFRRILSYMCHL